MSYLDYEPDDIDVSIAELLMATSDEADPLLHPKVQEALHILRDHLAMDVVFVSQISEGRRTFRVVDASPEFDFLQPGLSDPVEESWCQYVVDGRLPQLVQDAAPYLAAKAIPHTDLKIGTHLSTPVILRDGSVYGTLCCFSAGVKEDVSQADLRRLQLTAQLLAEDMHLDAKGKEEPQTWADTVPGKL